MVFRKCISILGLPNLICLGTCIMFERYCFTRSKSSIMSSSLLLTMLMLASMSLMLALGRCTLKMNWKQKAPQAPPRMGPTQYTLHKQKTSNLCLPQKKFGILPMISELIGDEDRAKSPRRVERTLVAGQSCHVGQTHLRRR